MYGAPLIEPSDARTPPFPPFRYQCALIDPPWRMETYSDKGRGRLPDGQGHYETMTLEAIKALPVPDVLERDALVFLWTTSMFLEHAFDVLEAWDLSYRSIAFTWAKLNPSGEGFHRGQGFYTKHNAELCLLARRGKGVRVISHAVEELIVSPRQRHSEKPALVRERIETLLGDVSRIELFARERTPGWRAWGLGVPRKGETS